MIATRDNQFRETAIEAARLHRCTAACVSSFEDLLATARSHSFSLAFLDHSVGGNSAFALARALRHNAPGLPFVLVGSELTTSVTVEAMKLGAFTVLEKPVARDEVVATIRSMIEARIARLHPVGATVDRHVAPRSTAERWAWYVLKGCEADGDLRTLGAWATFAGLSYSSLRESCRLAGIRPRNARDLTRVLRAVVQSQVQQCRVEELLDICDRRTLERLMTRAGLSPAGQAARISVEEFLAAQRFVPPNNTGLAVLRARLSR